MQHFYQKIHQKTKQVSLFMKMCEVSDSRWPCCVSAELTVTCLHTEECVLPCHFYSDGKGARIMWYKRQAVVSCTRYGNTSFVVGHNSAADRYRGRAALFSEQEVLLQGDASLLLRNVTPRDQGLYFCVTMTAQRFEESGVITLVVRGERAEPK